MDETILLFGLIRTLIKHVDHDPIQEYDVVHAGGWHLTFIKIMTPEAASFAVLHIYHKCSETYL